MRADPRDHIANVGDPLAEVIVLDPRECRRVALQDQLQRREGRQLLHLDQVVDLGEQGLVIDDLKVALKDARLGAAELLSDLRDDRLELRDRERHGSLEALDLGRDQARIGEHLRLPRPEHRVDSVRDPDHDARADCNSLVHNTLSLAKPRSLAQTSRAKFAK